MNKRYILLIFVFFIGLCCFLFVSFYNEAKQDSIKNLNVQQLLYAKQAARSIEDFFASWTTILTTLSRTDHIRDMDNAGRENIESLYKENSELLRAVTRVDASGRIIYTIPYDRNAIGRDISSQKHIIEIMKTRKPVISDVFFAVQGYSTVALHVPVFIGNAYHGTIGIGVNFQSLAKRYLENIRIGETGYAWIISRDGTELFCPVPGHAGNSVFKNCKDFPSILTMAEDMLKGHEGTAIYSFDKIREDTVEVVRKHAVYMPIPIGNTYWSIVVASSEDEVISSLKDFRNRLLVIIGILLLGGVLFSYYGLKALFIIQEEDKRKKAEEALRESEATIKALINNAPADSILLLDTKGVILDVNRIGAERIGKKREELIGINAYNALPEDVAGKRLEIMMKMFETGKLVRFEDKRADFWFDTVAFPILDKDNEIAKIAVIARDITKRKQLEELYSRMARDWQQTFDAISVAIWILDKDQRIIRSNKAAELLFHRSIYDMIGENCWQIVHGTDQPIPECPVSRARESLQHEKMDLQIGDNWFEIVVDPILDEQRQFAGAVHIMSDITERKWAEEWFEKLNGCFLNFSANQVANINLLVALCGEMFGAASALYNRVEGDMLCSVGQWNTPSEYKSVDLADGRICNDVIKGDGENYVLIRKLQGTSYAQSDPNVRPSQIQTYVGKAVQFKDVNIGSLCVVFLRDFIPSENQKRLLGIIASAIGIEEERRLAEESLQESRNLLDATQKLAKIGGWEWDLSGQRMTCTEQTYHIHGLNPGDIKEGSPEHIERSLACYDPDDRRIIEEAFRRCAGEGKPYNLEFPFTRADGSRIWIKTIAQPLIEDGRIVKVTGNIMDITERKQAEMALRESEELKQTILENITDFILLHQKGIIQYVNSAVYNNLCYKPEDLINKSIFNFIDPKYHETVTSAVIKRVNGEYIEPYEIEIYSKSGEKRTVIIAGNVIMIGGNAVSLNVITDITERKQAEIALRESEERFRRLILNVPGIAIQGYSPDGTTTYWNQASERLFGYSAEEAVGQSLLDLIIPPEMREEVKDSILFMCETGQPIPSAELSLRKKDGSRVSVFSSHALVHVSGRSSELFCMDVDLTDRKRAEEEKRKLEERFARAEKMEALGTLAGGVAHDLNNVLGIVVGYAELLLDEVEKTSPVREHVESIHNSGRKAAAMIDDMLTMARRGVQSRQVLNLNKIIMEGKDSPEFMRLSQQYSSVQIKEDIDPDLLNISGSPVHLVKTLFNLILNAFEAMPKGGLLTINTYNQYLEKPIKGYDEVRGGDYVVLSVSDTGTGINATDLKRIFEPFYTKKIMGRSGTGLGLAVVWNTVKDHNGYIDVQSEEGKGSTFMLYFPVSRDEITEERASVSVAEYTGKGESILVVDDVKGQRDLAAEMLKKLNYKVIAVPSGEEAVEYLKDNEVDIMLLDMIMEPGMDGLDTYKSVLEIRPKQKAIIVSGFSETDRVEKAQALGAGAYVKKPYVMEKLGLAVKSELERRQ